MVAWRRELPQWESVPTSEELSFCLEQSLRHSVEPHLERRISRCSAKVSHRALTKLSLASFAVAVMLSCVLASLLATERLQVQRTEAKEAAHRRNLLWHPQIRGENGLIDAAKDWARRNVEQNFTRHTSAHLQYKEPRETGKIKSWFHMLSPRSSADDTYFAVSGNGYGYMGLQQVRGFPWFQGKVVFSMWDQDDARVNVVECGHQSFCVRFGGEGTGIKTHMDFNKWQLGKEYAFMIRAYDMGATMVRQEGYLFAAELGGWVLMGILEVVKTDAKLPWEVTGMYSFVEQWSARDFGDARWARLGPSYVQYEDEIGWQQMRTSSFIANAKAGENVHQCFANVTAGGYRWGLGIGGGVARQEEGALLTVLPTPDMPLPLQIFNRLDERGALPRGCPGGTCASQLSTQWYDFFFQPSNFGRTAVICGILLAATTAICGCLRCLCCDDDEVEDGMLTVDCPKGHNLAAFIVPNHTFFCDGCQKKVPEGKAMHGCRPCKYTLCASCFTKQLNALQTVAAMKEREEQCSGSEAGGSQFEGEK